MQKLVIQAITFLGYRAFEQVGVEEFVGLLNNLHVGIDDASIWVSLLLDTVQSSKGACHLSYPHWESLVEFIALGSWVGRSTYSPHTMMFLEKAGEWKKLECWMGIVWILWPPGEGITTEDDLKQMTLQLFHQQPGAIQKLERWVEQWCRLKGKVAPELFQQICKQQV